MRRIGKRAVRWLVVAVTCALPVQGFALTVNTADIANGAVTTVKIADGAVTASKLGIVCANGEYLQYVFGSGWVCSVGTAGPAGPQGPTGPTGATGPQGPAGSMANYANVRVVAKSGGDFTDPIAALASISDASATNRYLVKIMPGVYDITGLDRYGWSTLYLREYVDIEGSGETNTIITSAPEVSYYGVINSSSNCALRKLKIVNSTVSNSGGIAYAVALNDQTVNFELSDVVIEMPNLSWNMHANGFVPGSPGPILLNNVKINLNTGMSSTGIEGVFTIKNSEIRASNAIGGNVFEGQNSILNSMINGAIMGSGIKCLGNYNSDFQPVACP